MKYKLKELNDHDPLLIDYAKTVLKSEGIDLPSEMDIFLTIGYVANPNNITKDVDEDSLERGKELDYLSCDTPQHVLINLYTV